MTAVVEKCRVCGRLIIENGLLPCPWCELATRTKQWAEAQEQISTQYHNIESYRREVESLRGALDRALAEVEELKQALGVARSGFHWSQTYSRVGRRYVRPGLHPRFRAEVDAYDPVGGGV